ncbi:penicillin-binding transpeptidase domain-containing protein [Salipaludibacillus agaradhaerens]|uniref:serine-type D-Ala-D-Ala carboxypeptidase n=1 Tax=Salipaludibacillus agaradhaerens TaxID=76935 RepID=A0A9Q4AYL6_SALAG|nr:penicillin-binding transpeptidase domain-containing protein [Salipaludibacillus agaradhaerens]MCR6095018.1 penicillin-binding transpeptidase domain-containing protein [Salipaludibacillus agaradhaerens]MCR6115424.1 penicillin-binding transpeptidase domain-containing protein [Salipaludibacillus agaradhaerens]
MIRTKFIIGLLTVVSVLTACKNEEPPHPEETLDVYLEAWNELVFAEMHELLSDASKEEIATYDWEFTDRYEKIYGDLEITTIETMYEPVDYKEENSDLDDLTEAEYPVTIEMNSVAGTMAYTTNIRLVKVEEENEKSRWEVTWEPSHLMMGMEDPHDQISVDIVQPNRGRVFDREGRELAINGEIYEAGIVPESSDDLEASAEQFASVLELEEEKVIDMASRYPDNPDWFAPVQTIALSDDRVEELLDIPGVLLNRIDGREYPYGEMTGHLVGHIGPISAEELEEVEGGGYASSSEIGKNGIELLYEDELRGSAGVTISIITEEGDLRDRLINSDPVDGEDIYLTIDMELQEKMAHIMSEDSGSAIVIDPLTGETLVLLSLPSFDPNLRYLQLPDPRAEDLIETDTLFERRFQRTYTPGSVFKPFTAMAGIEEGTLDPEEFLTIEGSQWQSDDSWGGYKITRVNSQETDVDLQTAMALSDNIYFARQALDLGKDSFMAWAEEVGFEDEGLVFDFPVDSSTIANHDLENDILLADSGYGQGEIQMSPVHLTALYTIMLNEGKMIQPILIQEREEREGSEQSGATPVVAADTALVLHETLISVVEDEMGTAHRENPGHSRSLAGKTGTAEMKEAQTAENGEEIGWYVSYDYENKDLLTTIMIQNVEDKGGSGYVVDLTNAFWTAINE